MHLQFGFQGVKPSEAYCRPWVHIGNPGREWLDQFREEMTELVRPVEMMGCVNILKVFVSLPGFRE